MPERSYADVIGRFRGGYGAQRASVGDFDGAQRVVRDPDLQMTYAAMGDRQRRVRQEEETRNASESYAGALASGDYGGAATIAGKVGDAEGVTGAREAETAETLQQRMELWRGARRGLAELEAIEGANGEGYEAFIQRGRDALAQTPSMDPELRRLIEAAPAEFNPRFTAAFRQYAQRLQETLLTPQQVAQAEQEQIQRERERRRTATPEEIAQAGLRPGTAAQIDGEGRIYVLQSPASGGGAGGAPPNGYAWQEDGTLAPIQGGPADRPPALTDGQRVASASVQRMEAAELELQRLEGVNPSEWANALEAVPIWGEGWGTGSRSAEQRALDQASNQWAEAFLRATSGAAVTADEIRRVERIFMPRPGDGPDELARKREARRVAMQAILTGVPQSPQQGGGDASPEPLPPANQRVRGQRYPMADGGSAEWDGRQFINPQRPGQ